MQLNDLLELPADANSNDKHEFRWNHLQGLSNTTVLQALLNSIHRTEFCPINVEDIVQGTHPPIRLPHHSTKPKAMKNGPVPVCQIVSAADGVIHAYRH